MIARRILIIGPSNIGDAILMSGVVALLRRRWPEAHLTLVVGARARALFIDDPRVQVLVDADRFDSALGRAKLAFALWRYRPQVVVDLRHTAHPLFLKPLSVWRYLRRPPRTIAHMRERQLWFLAAQAPSARTQFNTQRDSADCGLISQTDTLSATSSRNRRHPVGGVERRSRRVDPTGQAAAESPLWFVPRDETHVEALWSRWKLDAPSTRAPASAGGPRSGFRPIPRPSASGSCSSGACPSDPEPQRGTGVQEDATGLPVGLHARPVVVICPGARSHIKRWTAEGFARVADRLIADCGAEVVFSGEPDEKTVIDEILGLMRGRAHNAVGLVTIRQLGLLMRRARLVITNDSASLHMASAVGAPTVAIFGPTDEAKYGPTAPRRRTVRRRLFCAPCEQPLCRFSHECMRFISADEVFRAACELLEAGKSDPFDG